MDARCLRLGVKCKWKAPRQCAGSVTFVPSSMAGSPLPHRSLLFCYIVSTPAIDVKGVHCAYRSSATTTKQSVCVSGVHWGAPGSRIFVALTTWPQASLCRALLCRPWLRGEEDQGSHYAHDQRADHHEGCGVQLHGALLVVASYHVTPQVTRGALVGVTHQRRERG